MPELDALDERPVLQADLVVERDELVDPGLVDVRREEVVQKAPRSLGPEGTIGPQERFGWPGKTFRLKLGQRK